MPLCSDRADSVYSTHNHPLTTQIYQRMIFKAGVWNLEFSCMFCTCHRKGRNIPEATGTTTQTSKSLISIWNIRIIRDHKGLKQPHLETRHTKISRRGARLCRLFFQVSNLSAVFSGRPGEDRRRVGEGARGAAGDLLPTDAACCGGVGGIPQFGGERGRLALNSLYVRFSHTAGFSH